MLRIGREGSAGGFKDVDDPSMGREELIKPVGVTGALPAFVLWAPGEAQGFKG